MLRYRWISTMASRTSFRRRFTQSARWYCISWVFAPKSLAQNKTTNPLEIYDTCIIYMGFIFGIYIWFIYGIYIYIYIWDLYMGFIIWDLYTGFIYDLYMIYIWFKYNLYEHMDTISHYQAVILSKSWLPSTWYWIAHHRFYMLFTWFYTLCPLLWRAPPSQVVLLRSK